MEWFRTFHSSKAPFMTPSRIWSGKTTGWGKGIGSLKLKKGVSIHTIIFVSIFTQSYACSSIQAITQLLFAQSRKFFSQSHNYFHFHVSRRQAITILFSTSRYGATFYGQNSAIHALIHTYEGLSLNSPVYQNL